MKLIIILAYFIKITESLPLLSKSLITLRVLNDENSFKYKQIIIEEWNNDLNDIYQTWIIPSKKSADNVSCTFNDNNLIKLRCENLNCNKLWFQCNNQEVNASYSNENSILNSYIDSDGTLDIQMKSTNIASTYSVINENNIIEWFIENNKLIRKNNKDYKKESFDFPNNSSLSNLFGIFENSKFIIYVSNGTSIYKNDYKNLIKNVSFLPVLKINSNWMIKSFLIRSLNNSKFIKPTATVTKSTCSSYTPIVTPVQVNVQFNSNIQKYTSPTHHPEVYKINSNKKNLTKNIVKVKSDKPTVKNATNITNPINTIITTNVTNTTTTSNSTNTTNSLINKNYKGTKPYHKYFISFRTVGLISILIILGLTIRNIFFIKIKKKNSFYNLEDEYKKNDDKWSLPTISTPSSNSDSPRPTF